MALLEELKRQAELQKQHRQAREHFVRELAPGPQTPAEPPAAGLPSKSELFGSLKSLWKK